MDFPQKEKADESLCHIGLDAPWVIGTRKLNGPASDTHFILLQVAAADSYHVFGILNQPFDNPL